MPDYPASYPKPMMRSYSDVVSMRFARTQMDGGCYKQRRLANHSMPENFNFVFAVKYSIFEAWQNWVNENAYDYFNIDILSGQSIDTDVCLTRSIRFVSNLDVVPGEGAFVYVSVRAEAQGLLDFFDLAFWIIALLLEEVSQDWTAIDAGAIADYENDDQIGMEYANGVWIVWNDNNPCDINWSDDDGETWTALPSELNSGAASGADPNAITYGNNAWVASFPGGYCARSTDNGLTWSALTQGLNSGSTTEECFSIGTDGAGVWVAGFQSGFAARSTDNGVTWSALTKGLNSGSTTQFIYAIKTDGLGNWVATGSSGYCARSTDNGATWSALPRALNVSSITAVGFDMAVVGNIFVAVFSSGYASRSTDNGATWTELTRGLNSGSTTVTWNQISTSSAGVMVAIANDGYCARSTDSGANWAALPQQLNTGNPSTTDDGLSVATDDNGIWRAGFDGAFNAISEDDGATWFAGPMGIVGKVTTADINAIVAGANSVGLVAFNDGSVARSTDLGVNWGGLPQGLNSGSAAAIFYNFANNGARWIAVGDTWCAYSDDDGATWDAQVRGLGTGDTVNALNQIAVNRDTGVWIAHNVSGESARSTNNGDTFASLSSSSLGSGAGVSGVCGGCAQGKTKDFGPIPSRGPVWVAVYSDGFAARSYNDGATWTALTQGLGLSDPTTSFTCLATDKNGVWIAGRSNGTIAISIDNAENWSELTPQWLNSGATVGACEAIATDENGLWVAGFAGGYVALSTDNGANWSALTRGLNSGSTTENITYISHFGGHWFAGFEGAFASRPLSVLDRDFIIAGVPSVLSTDLIIAGTPGRPSVAL